MSNALITLPEAALATHASPRASSKYLFIPTTDIVSALADEGWVVNSAVQTKSKSVDRMGYQRHMLRFRPVDPDNQIHVGDSIAELLLDQSHDTSRSYRFGGGVFRLVCGNGMVVCETAFPGLRLNHKGSLSDIIQASLEVARKLPELGALVSKLKQTHVNEMQRQDFAARAIAVRYGEKKPLEPRDILYVRREQDQAEDLWTLFNVVQENIMRGGQIGVLESGVIRRMQPITGLSSGIGVNERLWELAMEYAA